MYFALLSLVWIYVVGIHQSQALEPLKDNSSHFIARFCPVLYMPQPLAVVFAVLSAGALGYQYYLVFIRGRRAEHVSDIEMGHVAQDTPVPAPEKLPVIQESLEEYEEMFRLAKQSRSQ